MKKENVINEILELKGDCFSDKRCMKCPFFNTCATSILYFKFPSKEERIDLAISYIVDDILDK